MKKKTKKKIVVIEDEEDLCFLIKSIFEDTGQYKVFTAYDGIAGENLCLREKPDLIFVDFVMPKEKGDKVIEFLKKNPETKDIPVVLMTGLGEMFYSKTNGEWQWSPRKFLAQDGGAIAGSLKWEKIPYKIAGDLGVRAVLPKPCSKEALLDVAHHMLNEAKETEIN